MPTCLNCGNNKSFASSNIPPVAPVANGPISGLYADFDDKGSFITVQSVGASNKDTEQAWAEPQKYFDTCTKCGSNKILWL